MQPFAFFQHALDVAQFPALNALIERKKRHDGVRLIRRGALSLAEIDDEDDADRPRVALGERFRIEFPLIAASPHAIGLQHADQRWRAFALGRDQENPRLLMPGLSKSGDPSFMYEVSATGQHRFACIQTLKPVPAIIVASIAAASALDRLALDALAAHISENSESAAIHVLDLDMEVRQADGR